VSTDSVFFNLPLTLAQAASQPPVPGAVGGSPAPAAPGVQGAPAGSPAPGGAAPANPFGGMIWIFLLVIILMFVMTSMTGRKQEKQRKAMLTSVKRNDRVQTVGGIIGTVIELTEHEMVLRVDESSNTRIRFARSALQQLLRESKEPARADLEAKPRSETASV
jgi:preprotein translocase subunit YajC